MSLHKKQQQFDIQQRMANFNCYAFIKVLQTSNIFIEN